jgi:hypothetical protein
VSHGWQNCRFPPTDLNVVLAVAHLATSSGLRNGSGCNTADCDLYSVVGRRIEQSTASGGGVGGHRREHVGLASREQPICGTYESRSIVMPVITGRQPLRMLSRHRDTVLLDAAVRATSIFSAITSGCLYAISPEPAMSPRDIVMK